MEQFASVTIESLLKRVYIFLEEENWSKADEYCERILDADPENAEAYLGKLLAELHFKTVDDLEERSASIRDKANYAYALRYSAGERQNEIRDIADAIDKRILDSQKSEEYFSAVRMYSRGTTKEDFRTARDRFIRLNGLWNSAEYAERCDAQIRSIEDREEKERQEKSEKEKLYADALKKHRTSSISELEESIKRFSEISDWPDAEKMIDICRQKIESIRQEEERKKKEEQEKREAAARLKRTLPWRILLCVVCLSLLAGYALFSVLRYQYIAEDSYYRYRVSELNRVRWSYFWAFVPWLLLTVHCCMSSFRKKESYSMLRVAVIILLIQAVESAVNYYSSYTLYYSESVKDAIYQDLIWTIVHCVLYLSYGISSFLTNKKLLAVCALLEFCYRLVNRVTLFIKYPTTLQYFSLLSGRHDLFYGTQLSMLISLFLMGISLCVFLALFPHLKKKAGKGK